MELVDQPLIVSFTPESNLHVDKTQVPTLTDVEGIVGEKTEHALNAATDVRPQAVAYTLAKRVMAEFFSGHDGAPKTWLFPRLVDIAKQWVTGCVTYEPGINLAYLATFAELQAKAAERIFASIVRQVDAAGSACRRRCYGRFPGGSTPSAPPTRSASSPASTRSPPRSRP